MAKRPPNTKHSRSKLKTKIKYICMAWIQIVHITTLASWCTATHTHGLMVSNINKCVEYTLTMSNTVLHAKPNRTKHRFTHIILEKDILYSVHLANIYSPSTIHISIHTIRSWRLINRWNPLRYTA